MTDLKTIPNSLEETLKDSNLQEITTDLAEALLDTAFEEGLLKDIPIIGTLLGLGKTAIKLSDRLLLKKIIYFISELKDIDISKRKEMILRIDSSKKQRIKVGEKLLYISDKCADHETTEFVAMLFAAFLNEKITYSEFLKSSLIIERIFVEDLKNFIENNWEELPIADAGEFISAGLLELYTEDVTVEDQWDHDLDNKYIVKGGNAKTYITPIGIKVRQILRRG
jgi:uncharacterized ubiquitin-like protein YukD